jgi:SpoVK/Ycf46/Vps4 family AAA+-type ATPase
VNASILKRIVRAMAEGSQPDLDLVAEKVVETERTTGHPRLAKQLESIIAESKQRRNGRPHRPASPGALQEMPQSRRYGEHLARLIPRDQLQHNMVLPPAIEERFARIECEYAARERLGAYGLMPRKTILLYGPPGCGKSLGANRLAWNTGLPLMKVRFDALISSFFGESAANLRTIFISAKERPCVLLLDECDLISRSRVNSKDIGEAIRIVNTLLQLMEDYDAPGLLVATTNVESSLDEALFRRFDDVFMVPLPGRAEVERLLRLTLESVSVDEHVNWEALVDGLSGASAAAVVKVARDAAKSAVLKGRKIVMEAHLRNAVSETRRESRGEQKE